MNSRGRFLVLDQLKVKGYHFTPNLMDFVKNDVVRNMDDLYCTK